MKNIIAEQFKDNLHLGNLIFVKLYRLLPNILREYGLLIVSKFIPKSKPETKVLIYAQGRSGSTLLVDLLNSHPDIFLFGEILYRDVIYKARDTLRFINSAMTLNKNKVVGFKVSIYQFEKSQQRNPHEVLKEFVNDGWKIIYLHRDNLFEHAISDIRSEKTNVWHKLDDKDVSTNKIEISIDELLQNIEYREQCYERELTSLKEIPHIRVSYEDDLKTAELQESSSKKILAYLGINEHKLSTRLKKVAKKDPNMDITNYKDLANYIKSSKYSKFII